MPAEDRDPPAKRTPQAPPSAEELADRRPIINSESLFQGAQELLIQHGEQIYRLRLTRNGKLILNK